MKAKLVSSAVIALLAPAVAQAGKLTCLTGTDPVVANDRPQIAAVRAVVDAACVCGSIQGSTGSARGSYTACAVSIINNEVALCHLRSQCEATVKAYYATSTCGRQSKSFGTMVPCIKTITGGKVTCVITPSARCVDSPGRYTKTACVGFRTCVEAADTNNDGVIGPGDTGACVTESLATPTSTQTSTPTLAPSVPTSTPVPPTATLGPLPRFVDNSDGTITDSQTGLMWEKKDQAGGLHQFTSKHKWAGTCANNGRLCQPNAAAASACAASTGGTLGCSQCAAGTCNTSGYGTIWDWLVQLNASNFAGYNDWRIPRVAQAGGTAELETIAPYPYPCGELPGLCVAPAFDTGCAPGCSVTDCSCTAPPSSYWSATTDADYTPCAWNVVFAHGRVDCDYKISVHVVRAVRGGAG